MVSLRKPSAASIRAFLNAQAAHGLTYAAVGATSGTPPAGYVLDHTRALLGEGEATFERARLALERWDQFRMGWVGAEPTDIPPRQGAAVAIAARLFGLWWLSACRIVAVVDDDGPVRRAGFAYGTLPDHAGSGEERFLVEWDRRGGEVWFDILAFSRPRWLLARLVYPYMRRLQRRFGRDCVAAMRAAVADATAPAVSPRP